MSILTSDIRCVLASMAIFDSGLLLTCRTEIVVATIGGLGGSRMVNCWGWLIGPEGTGFLVAILDGQTTGSMDPYVWSIAIEEVGSHSEHVGL
jgi:hypothetical protein